MKRVSWLALASALTLLFLYLPIFILAAFSFNASRYTAHWTGFTWHWYASLLENEDILRATLNSLAIASASSLLATALATGAASDPVLGDPRFVSSDRIGLALNRLSWFSTTLYLSAVLTDFAPARLVVDPSSNYFWLSCATATANLNAERAVPRETRALVRTYDCLHR